ncbi:hypothetical protein ACIBRY_07175 [Streptomyces anulatus]
MQRLLQPSQGGIDDTDVLVRPPAADHAHRGFAGGDVECSTAAISFGVGEAVAVVDREGSHHRSQLREGSHDLIAYGLGRANHQSPPLAPASESAEKPHGGVLGSDLLMDESQVRQPAEKGSGTVQGLARAQDHHPLGARLQSASGPQGRRLRKAPSDEGDLVRKPPQEARPAA